MKFESIFTTNHEWIRLFLAEFISTAFLIIIGDGSVAQSVLSNGKAGQFLSINFAWGFAVAFGVFISGGISGGHLNPSISLAFAMIGELKWIYVPVYMAGQYLGAFSGAAVVYSVYYVRYVTGNLSTAGIFSTYPQQFVSTQQGFVDQIVGTAILSLCVLALTNRHYADISKGLAPLLIGFVVAAIGVSYGFNCGYAINPARDLGPRLFTLVAGWGMEVFQFRNYNWFWVPIVGPHIGAILGTIIFKIFIGFQHGRKVVPF